MEVLKFVNFSATSLFRTETPVTKYTTGTVVRCLCIRREDPLLDARRPFGARGMSSVRYGIRLGDLKNKQPTHTGKLVHRSEIYHKSSPPRGWDGCTFVGADLRVCGLWVRSRSLAANHAGGPGYILLPALPERSRPCAVGR